MWHYQFENPIVFSASGADVVRYLNARLSNTLTLLNPAQAMEAAILTAQGKTEGFFTILKQEDSFLLYCTGGTPDVVLQAFKRFLVADRVVVDVEDRTLLHINCLPNESLPDSFPTVPDTFLGTSENDGLLAIRSNRLGECGVDIVCSKDKSAQAISELLTLGSTALSYEDFDLLRIKNGSLSFPEEMNEHSLFAESELTHAVSFSKGCYVGQEALEMLAARGKLPARIVMLQAVSDASLQSNSPLYESPGGKRIGQILSVRTDATTNTHYALARVKTANATSATIYTEAGTPCAITPRTIP